MAISKSQDSKAATGVAGAVGRPGLVVLALGKRRLDMPLLKQALDNTAKLASFVLFILIGSSVFSLVFRGVNGDLWVEHLLTSLPGGNAGFLIVVNLLFFGLAFFLDFFELAFILVPLVGPVADKMGIDLIWFGVLLSVNMQTSFMHPPFGFALFFHNYSTFLSRRGLYLEDLYVRPAMRRRGVGRALLTRLAAIAVERGCGRMEWSVLDWNTDAIAFYDGLHADNIVAAAQTANITGTIGIPTANISTTASFTTQ